MSWSIRPILAEISKVQLAERIAKLIETWAASASVQTVIGAAGEAGVTVAVPALMLVGMELLGAKHDGTRADGFEEHCKLLAGMLRSLDLRLDAVVDQFDQTLHRRSWVWTRLSGADQALIARRTAKALAGTIAVKLQCQRQASEEAIDGVCVYLEELLCSVGDLSTGQAQQLGRIEQGQTALATADQLAALGREILGHLQATPTPSATGTAYGQSPHMPQFEDMAVTVGLSEHARIRLCHGIGRMMRQNRIREIHPSIAARYVQHATETEAVRGIVSARSFLTHELTASHVMRGLTLGVPPLSSGATLDSPPPATRRIRPTSVVVPVSLVSSYVLLEFVGRGWRIPLNTTLVSTVSGLPLLRVLEGKRPDLAVIPAIMHQSLIQSNVGADYVPLTVLGHGTHALIAPVGESTDVPHLRCMPDLDVLCIGLRTPQRFLVGLSRIGVLDNRRVSVTSLDPAINSPVQQAGIALRNKHVVAAFFPVNMIFPAIGLGTTIPLDRYSESYSSHLLLARRDLAQDRQWADLLTTTMHAARDCLENDTRLCRAFVQEVVASDAYVNALMPCLR